MRRRRIAAWVALAIALGAIAWATWMRTPTPDAAPAPPPRAGTPPGTGTVLWVADGDTLDVQLDGGRQRIRLLNIDSPELGRDGAPDQCLAVEARAALEALAPRGAGVEVVGHGHDRFGRLLAGVRTPDGLLVNAEVVRRGLAAPLVAGGNTALLDDVLDARNAVVQALPTAVRDRARAEAVRVGATAVARQAALTASGVR